MIGIFKQKTAANFFLLLILGLLIKLPMFIHPHVPVFQGNEGMLYHLLMQYLKPFGNTYPALYSILAFILLYSQAVVLNRLFNNQRMMNRSTYLVGVSYLLITSLFPEWNYFSAPLLLNTFLIIIIAEIFKLYQQQKALGKIFNTGLLAGIISLIYLPSVVFLLWIFMGLLVMRSFRINEWLLCLMGFLAPYYFYGIYLFLTDQWDFQKLLPHFHIAAFKVEQSLWVAFSAFFIVIPFLIGGFYIQDNLGRMLIKVRKNWGLVLLFLLVAFFIPFINYNNSYQGWVIMAIPFAAFHAFAYLYPAQPWFPKIIFWFNILFVIAFQYYGPGW